jgi:adenylylsulfate kinase
MTHPSFRNGRSEPGGAAETATPADVGTVVWIFGLSGAGKSTLASALEQRLRADGCFTRSLDGDDLRSRLNRDLGFGDRDRAENIRRAAEVARLLAREGGVTICSFITPLRVHRAMARDIVSTASWLGVYAAAPYEICARRDPKGLYARALAGALPSFTGRDSVFEPPTVDEGALVIPTGSETPAESTARLYAYVSQRIGRGPAPSTGCTI